MMLLALILIPVAGGLLAWFCGTVQASAARWVALATLLIELAVTLAVGFHGTPAAAGSWLAETRLPWIPPLGVALRLDLDGMSLLLILLTSVLAIVSILASWTEIVEHVGLFHLLLLLTIAGVMGVFLALDLFLFFVFWELMLVPMYFLIVVFGHEQRAYAGIKFFIFTQGSGLLMLAAILALVLAHSHSTGTLTFDYAALLGTSLDPRVAFWIMLGFFVAFVVKLPAFPFHSWLPDAHTQAPTAGSVILAGVMLKTGAYGLLRFVVPLFPQAAHQFAPLAMLLGVIGILYGGILAFAQTDMKRLVAYSSVSHMGFVLLGVFAWSALAFRGVVIQMLAHGLTTGALFIVVGLLQQRLHTRDMQQMGGLAARIPRLSGLALLFVIATLGLPGLANFVGEFLVLAGSFGANAVLTGIAASGLVISVIYALALFQRAFQGEPRMTGPLADLSLRETATLGVLALIVLGLGVYPQPVLDIAAGGLAHVPISLPRSEAQVVGLQP
jgi:NADH-quinone oxidoreductase subunit M